MTKSEIIHEAMPGAHVTGKYMGTPFSGIINQRRYHTMNHMAVEFRIVLDQPIEPFPGTVREVILMTVYADGVDIDSPVNGYMTVG